MNIKQYFEQPVLSRMTQVELAEKATALGYNCTQSFLSQIIKGKRDCPIKLAKGLHLATRGAINKKEIHPDIF